MSDHITWTVLDAVRGTLLGVGEFNPATHTQPDAGGTPQLVGVAAPVGSRYIQAPTGANFAKVGSDPTKWAKLPMQAPDAATAFELAAHRGGGAIAPENTLAAFSASVGLADAAEFDIHPTADGELVVIHDDTVDRTTGGTGNVMDMTLAELQALDAGSWFAAWFAGTKIPTLTDVLAFCGPRFRRLYPEIKNYRTGHEAADSALMVQAILDAGLEQRAVIQSARITDLAYVRAVSNLLTFAYVADNATQWDQALPSLAADGNACMIVNQSVVTGDPSKVTAARAVGVDVIAYTVDTSDQLRALLAVGVARIISNTLVRPGVPR